MSTNPNQVEEISPRAEQLAELARTELGQLSNAQRSRGLNFLNRRLEGRHQPWRFARWGMVAVVVMLAFGIGRFAFEGRSAPVLTYELDGQKIGVPGGVVAVARQRTLRFSEGSEVTLSPGAHAAVRALDDRGAQLSLASGTLSVEVTPRPNASWSVSAGPFLIRVTGTRFTVEWKATQAQLLVRLLHGSVVVTGPLASEPVRLHAGQQLQIGLHEREVLIRELDPADESLLEQPAPPAAGSVTPPGEKPLDSGPELVGKPTIAPSASARRSWASEVSTGEFDAILDDAKTRGIEHVLRTISSDELAALADAARYRKQSDLARRALRSQRERFGSSSRARDAAFLLGRLEEAAGALGPAVTWFETYLSEAPGGTYASEALGRKMLLVQTREGKEHARQVAQDYLRRFPTGAYAKAARSLE